MISEEFACLFVWPAVASFEVHGLSIKVNFDRGRWLHITTDDQKIVDHIVTIAKAEAKKYEFPVMDNNA